MEVFKAISDVQAALAPRGIAKGRKNTQGAGFNFRGIDDILNALGPLMPQHGLTVIPRMVEREISERQSKSGGVLFFVTVKADFDFVAVSDGSKITATTFGEAMDSSDKATTKAMSVAWKSAAILTFQIPVQGENDADATSHQVKPIKQEVEKPFPNGPARGLSDLKQLWRAFWSEVESCDDADQLDALLAIEGNRKLMRQLKEALPDWWNGGKAKGEEYEGAGERLAKIQTDLADKANGGDGWKSDVTRAG
jgi:hypothetical protein